MIKENILKIKKRIASVCAKNNRDPQQITIVAVAKNRTVGQIKEVVEVGITDIGENRVQEALLKYNQLRTREPENLGTREFDNSRTYELKNLRTINWHLVGHLQTNKVKEAARIFDLIHSVDSLRLAEEIDKQAAKINKVQDILIEVNTSGEASKFGLKPEEVKIIVKEISSLKNISLKGLMTIAPIADNPEQTRPYFRKLRELRDKVNELRVMSYELRILSMGMSDDFEVAIEEGATMVRIGRAIFED